MPQFTPSRLVHFAGLCLVLGLLAYCALEKPEFWKDDLTTFATVGGFFTIYGVSFAIIETWRTRSAAELAREAASDASGRLASLYDVRSISECQACIRIALRDLEGGGRASTATLARILELYTAQFHQAYTDANSPERELIASLESHAAANEKPSKGRALARHKTTLIRMLADVTAAESAKLTEKPK